MLDWFTPSYAERAFDFTVTVRKPKHCLARPPFLWAEGDLIGKTREQLRALHFRRDRDWLQS